MSGFSDTQDYDPPARDQASLGGDYGPRGRVAADLDEIFSLLPSAAATTAAVATDRAVIRKRTTSRPRRIILFIGLLLLAIPLFSLAVRMIWLQGAAEGPAPAPRRPPIAVRTAPAPPIAPTVLPTRDEPVVHRPVAHRPVAHRPLVHHIASRPSQPKPEEGQKRKKPQPRPIREEKPAAPTPSLAQCAAGGGSEAWCLRAQSIAADDRLRDAYQAAVGAHVDRRALVGINKKWVRLRKRALKDPAGMISGYTALTEELRRETGLVAPK